MQKLWTDRPPADFFAAGVRRRPPGRPEKFAAPRPLSCAERARATSERVRPRLNRRPNPLAGLASKPPEPSPGAKFFLSEGVSQGRWPQQKDVRARRRAPTTARSTRSPRGRPTSGPRASAPHLSAGGGAPREGGRTERIRDATRASAHRPGGERPAAADRHPGTQNVRTPNGSGRGVRREVNDLLVPVRGQREPHRPGDLGGVVASARTKPSGAPRALAGSESTAVPPRGPADAQPRTTWTAA